MVSTQGDANQVIAYPTPATGLPAPGSTEIMLPPSTFPHGIAFGAPDRALVANISQSEVVAFDPSTGAVLNEIDVSPSYAGGTVAIAPGGDFALVAGERGTAYGGTPETVLVTIEDPFGPAPTTTTVNLPHDQIVEDYQTRGIVFAATGRAFVATQHEDFDAADPASSPNTSYVHVLDPPYTSITFSMPIPVYESRREVAEGIALTPDESQLLVASNGDVLWVVDAPFTPAGATLYAVTVGSGRGAGGVEFASPRILGDGFETGDVSRWSASLP